MISSFSSSRSIRRARSSAARLHLLEVIGDELLHREADDLLVPLLAEPFPVHGLEDPVPVVIPDRLEIEVGSGPGVREPSVPCHADEVETLRYDLQLARLDPAAVLHLVFEVEQQ